MSELSKPLTLLRRFEMAMFVLFATGQKHIVLFDMDNLPRSGNTITIADMQAKFVKKKSLKKL